MISGDVLKYLNGFAVAMGDNYEQARQPSNLSDSAVSGLNLGHSPLGGRAYQTDAVATVLFRIWYDVTLRQKN
jgi:hypothetical protein